MSEKWMPGLAKSVASLSSASSLGKQHNQLSPLALIACADFSILVPGLFISNSITELHGGVLLARSEGLGHGSTFTVVLPLYIAPTDTATLHRDLESNKVRVCCGR